MNLLDSRIRDYYTCFCVPTFMNKKELGQFVQALFYFNCVSCIIEAIFLTKSFKKLIHFLWYG